MAMARSTRYYQTSRYEGKRAYKRTWEPTEVEKELAAKFGYGSQAHIDDNRRHGRDWTQEDKYRLQLWMEEAQLGSLENLNFEEGQLELALQTADAYLQHAADTGKTFDWNSGSHNPDTIRDLTESLSGTEGYEYLARDLPNTSEGLFDISDEYTTGLQNLNEQYAQSYESKYIDEMYGTEGAVAGTEGGGLLATGSSTELGLDLVRDFDTYIINRDYGVDTLEIGSDEHYEHMTRGEVDWSHYRDEPKYQKAFRLLGYDLPNGKGNHADQINQIRQASDIIRYHEDKPGLFGALIPKVHGFSWRDINKAMTEWHKDDWKYELTGEEYTINDDGRLYKGDEMQIEFTELMDPESEYYVAPGTSQEFQVGEDQDGRPLFKTYESPVTRDLSNLIYNPDDYDQTEEHVAPSGQVISAKVEKTRDVERPDIDGISWESGSPVLTNAVTKKKAPTIKPISTKSYAQEE